MPQKKKTRSKPPAATHPEAISDSLRASIVERFGESAQLTRREDGALVVHDLAPDPQRAVFALERGEFMTWNNPATGEQEEVLPVSFSSELPVRDYWGDREILSHDPDDADFSRLAEIGGVLRNHDPDQLVGVPVRVWLDAKERKGRSYLRFGTTPDALNARREVEDGMMRGISVGYVVDEWVLLENENVAYKGRIKGPAWVASKWSAIEYSLTPIPRDPSVGVNRSLQLERNTDMDRNKKPDPRAQRAQAEAEAAAVGESAAAAAPEAGPAAGGERAEAPPAPPAPTPAPAQRAVAQDPPAPPAPPDVGEAARRAMREERVRQRELRNIASTFHVDGDVLEDAIDDGLTVAEFSRQVVQREGERRQPIGAEVVRDERSKFSRSVGEGLQLRAGRIRRDQVKHDGNVFASRSLLQIAEECCSRGNVDVRGMSVSGLIAEAMRGPAINSDILERFNRGETISGSTSDFPYILANTTNKSLIDGFRLARTTYELWCSVVSLVDFKQASRIKVSETGDLLLVGENGTYKATRLAEKRETIQLATYGRKLSQSRQSIINDDLSVFTTVPERMGRRAARKPNQLAVKMLLSNPVMSDSVALFASGHSNLSAETDRKLDTLAHAKTGLAYLVKLLRKQTAYIATQEEETEYLDLDPRIWLVNADDEIIARQTINSIADASQSNAGVQNPFKDMTIQVAVEPNLQNPTYTGYSDTAYYLFADPAEAPVIEVAFLQGNREPYMEEINQTDADGRVYKVRLDCAAAAVDTVGAAKETGVDA